MAEQLPRWILQWACAAALALLPGCVPVAVTAAGVGMATGVSHTLGGIVYKTFRHHRPRCIVRRWLRWAHANQSRRNMRDGNKELIKARAADRDIEIEIEGLTPNTTRLTVTAAKERSLLRDSATATEIILQTEKMVGTA